MKKRTDWMTPSWGIGVVFVLGCGAQGQPDLGLGSEPPEQASIAQAVTSASCTQESDCTGGLACVAGTCQPCAAHDQCQSDVCDQGAATPMGPGACIPEASVVYVKANGGPDCNTGDGSRANPDCDIDRGIGHAVGLRYAVRVYPGRYFPFGVNSRTVFLFGPGDGSVVVGEEDDFAGAGIRNGSRVVLDGLDFGVHVLDGLICDGSDLKVARSTIQGDYNGMLATDCTLTLDRVRVETLVHAGLTVEGTGKYRITNSYFKGADSPGVVFSGSSTGIFEFNTVTGGGSSAHHGGIDCGTTSQTIQDSIVVNSSPGDGGAQTVGACTHERVVVGSRDTRPDAGLIKVDPDLDPLGRLLETPANDACCIDHGERFASSLYRDFFGTPRPQGRSNDIGAHELVPPLRCTQESDCSGGLACLAGVCQPCAAHGQCQSDVCDQSAVTSMGPGACVAQSSVVYVDANSAPACATGDGSRANPVCQIRDAIPLIGGPRFAARVYPGHYLNFAADGSTLSVFGPGDGSATVGQEDVGSAVRVTNGSHVVLDGLDYGGGVVAGVTCAGSTLRVARGTANADFTGIRAIDCALEVNQVRARGSDFGLRIDGTGTYRVTNSFFRGGLFPAVVFDGSSTGVFEFNTVTGGGSSDHPGGIDCGTTSRVIQDSIVVGNAPADGGAQTVGACTHERVVVGSADTRLDPGLISVDPELDSQGRLLDTLANTICCIDRGNRFASGLYRDFFGTPRPQGLSNDIGAHELPQVLQASADTHVRNDFGDRFNDNYGCQESIEIGSSNSGSADAMRGLVQFDLSSLTAFPFVQKAVLEMTLSGFDHGLPDLASVYTIGAFRIIPSGARTPWLEGNGVEGDVVPLGCKDVNEASGVAWFGNGDGGDLNNQTQPDFDPQLLATATIVQASDVPGDVFRWDVTDLVRAWTGATAPNLGIMLRETSGDGSFRGVRFGARDGFLRFFPGAVAGPRLIVTLTPQRLP